MFKVLQGKMSSDVRNAALGCWYDLRQYIDSEMERDSEDQKNTETLVSVDQSTQTSTDCCLLKESAMQFIYNISSSAT